MYDSPKKSDRMEPGGESMKKMESKVVKRQQSGFTLIELMIVVAIIGILAAIAVPRYQDYVARAQVSEALSLASGLKVGIMEAYASTGEFTGIESGEGNLPAESEVKGNNVGKVAVADGVITATIIDSAAEGSLKLEPKDQGGSIVWECTSTDIPGEYLPQNCTGSSTQS